MNKKMHFFLKTGPVTAMFLIGLSMPVSATPLFPRTIQLPFSPLSATVYPDHLTGDFNGDGNVDIAVVLKSSPGGGYILPADSNGDFDTRVPFFAGNAPSAIARGDFNADSNADLVIVNTDDNTVSILLGDGAGSFSAASGSPVTVGTTPLGVVTADFNADSKMDVAVTNTADSTVSILLGNGSGGFSATASSPATGTGVVAIVAGDVNADSKPDLMVTNSLSGNVSVLLGDGSGGFTAAVPLLTGNKPVALALADFNGDGKPDLAVANSGSASVSVLMGNGSGGFAATAAPFTVGNKPIDLQVADINGDGKLDIATANVDGGNVSVLLGDGSGVFATAINITTNASPVSIVINDYDEDGNADISTTNIDGTVTQLWGKGTGGFYNIEKKFSVADSPSSVAVGDVNNDGSPDLVVASSPGSGGNIKVLENSGTGDFSNLLTTATLGTRSAISTVVLADLVGNSDIDMAVTNSVDNKVAVLEGDGAGFFAPVAGSPFSVGTEPQAIAVGDMTNDGNADLVVANKGSNNVSLLKNTGADSFTTSATLSVGTGPVSVALADLPIALGGLDTDGKLDIITANVTGNTLTTLHGNGFGGQLGITVTESLTAGTIPFSVVIGNLDGDVLPDRVVANRSGSITVSLGVGTSSIVSVPGVVDSAVIGDFNSDGRADIAVLTVGSLLGGSESQLYVLLADGAGAYSVAPRFPLTVNKAGASAVDLATGDFNGDGLTDLVLVNDNWPVVKILLNLDPRPVAKTDSATTTQNTAVTTGNVLSNDVDANQTASLSISAVDTSSANGGSVTNNGDNTFTYLPAADFSGNDSFNYTVTDGWMKTAIGKVNVTVNAVTTAATPAAPPAPSGGGGGSFNLYLLMLLPSLFLLRCKR